MEALEAPSERKVDCSVRLLGWREAKTSGFDVKRKVQISGRRGETWTNECRRNSLKNSFYLFPIRNPRRALQSNQFVCTFWFSLLPLANKLSIESYCVANKNFHFHFGFLFSLISLSLRLVHISLFFPFFRGLFSCRFLASIKSWKKMRCGI